MSKYIDIEKAIPLAIEAIVEVVGHGISQIDAVHIADKFEEAPAADVVEVVRCKDCAHYDDGECGYHSEPGEQRAYERWTVDVNENDFCSYGERREK